MTILLGDYADHHCEYWEFTCSRKDNLRLHMRKCKARPTQLSDVTHPIQPSALLSFSGPHSFLRSPVLGLVYPVSCLFGSSYDRYHNLICLVSLLVLSDS
jgi:hypothetical protein